MYPLLLLRVGLVITEPLFSVSAQQSSWGTCGFLLCVRQLATLLGYHTSLPPVG